MLRNYKLCEIEEKMVKIKIKNSMYSLSLTDRTTIVIWDNCLEIMKI